MHRSVLAQVLGPGGLWHNTVGALAPLLCDSLGCVSLCPLEDSLMALRRVLPAAHGTRCSSFTPRARKMDRMKVLPTPLTGQLDWSLVCFWTYYSH